MKSSHRPPSIWLLSALVVVLAISALGGGGSLVLDPSGGGLGMTTALLDGSPFRDFRIPGVVLFCVFGVGGLIVGHGVWHRARFPFLQNLNPVTSMHWGWAGAVGVGWAHVGWIVVQVGMIGYASLLQPIYALLGVAIALVPLTPSARAFLRTAPVRPDSADVDERRGGQR